MVIGALVLFITLFFIACLWLAWVYWLVIPNYKDQITELQDRLSRESMVEAFSRAGKAIGKFCDNLVAGVNLGFDSDPRRVPPPYPDLELPIEGSTFYGVQGQVPDSDRSSAVTTDGD